MVLLYHWPSFHRYWTETASAEVKSDKHLSNTQKVTIIWKIGALPFCIQYILFIKLKLEQKVEKSERTPTSQLTTVLQFLKLQNS